jgi:conjugal transfer pilus assembly protein TraF
LSVEWLQVHLDRYKNRAIDDPTPDNVRAYLLLQRVSMDKASAFAEAVQAATVGDPLLDATMERPIASFAAQEMDRTAHRARQALIGVLAETVGLVFFYRSDCPFCERQAPILAGLSEATGLSVMAVAVDHRPMASGAFAADWTPDRGQAAALGVQTVPAIYALRPPGEAALIAQGLMDLTELTSRLLLVARQQGWISEEAFEATRPVRRQTVSPSVADLDAATLEDPAALVAALRSRMTRGGAP